MPLFRYVIIKHQTNKRPYMHRWHVIPRNRWLNIYFHKVVQSDDDRALHDHPWWNMSIILKGRVRELLPDGTMRLLTPGSFQLRSPTDLHRLKLIKGAPYYSLFITGPRVRDWGFMCQSGWVKGPPPGEDFQGCE